MSPQESASQRRAVSPALTTDSIETHGNDPTAHDAIRVVLVSDALITRAGLRHLLEALGVAVVAEAGAGDDALRVIHTEHPHIVLLDSDSSSSAAVFFQALLSGKVPVIVLSDQTRVLDHSTWLASGAMGVVMKNESPAVLLKAICKVHGGEAWIDRIRTAEVLGHVSRRKRFEDAEEMKIASLTAREREIIALLGDGLNNDVIAQRLFISQATVRNHLTSILDKLGVANRFELAVYGFRRGLIQCAPSSPQTSQDESVAHRRKG